MDFALDSEQQMVAQTLRRFVDKELRGWAADADRAAAPPPRLAAVAGELGFYLDAVPEAAGGLLDGAYSHLARALRGLELGRGCAALAALLECNVEPALAAARWGGAEAQAALFGHLAGGGLATTGRDQRGRLTVDHLPGGALRVDGVVGPLPGLADAGYVLLLAADAVVLLPADAPGATRAAITTSGWHAARWGTLRCDRVEVDPARVLARGAAAADVQQQVLSWARLSLAARATGVAVAAMEHAAQYGRERVQFGQPIGTFESLIRLRDDAETAAAASRLLVLHAAWLTDQGAAGAADAASRARVAAGDAVTRATVDAVQILGGYGFVNDYPVEKLMRDARPFEALLGDERFDRALARKAG